MNIKYKKEDCPVCKSKGKIYVKLYKPSKHHKHREENCPGCNGRRYLTILNREYKNE